MILCWIVGCVKLGGWFVRYFAPKFKVCKPKCEESVSTDNRDIAIYSCSHGTGDEDEDNYLPGVTAHVGYRTVTPHGHETEIGRVYVIETEPAELVRVSIRDSAVVVGYIDTFTRKMVTKQLSLMDGVISVILDERQTPSGINDGGDQHAPD